LLAGCAEEQQGTGQPIAAAAPPPIRGTRVVVAEVFADGARLSELVALVDSGLLTLCVACH
jgi:hypothetical protein